MIQGTLGFLGFGNMGSAILEGLLEGGAIGVKHAVVYDPDPARRDAANLLGIAVAETAAGLAEKSDTLILAVKPQAMAAALDELMPGFRADTLIISIAAGLPIAWFQERLGPATRVIRVMPNTPALVHEGASGIALGPGCTEADAATARNIFEAVGIAELVPETAIDAVTALSGSGPAYFFYMVECLVAAAAEEGLDRGVAQRLAAQTLVGAGLLLGESDASPEELRTRVTSKGGTTEAALEALRGADFREVVRKAVHAAAARSRELAR